MDRKYTAEELEMLHAVLYGILGETDRVTEESLRRLQRVPFGPLTVTAPDDMEGFLRFNYPNLHRYTEAEVKKLKNHCPVILSFDTAAKQEP